MKGLTGFVALTALLGALAFAGSASATTFCVPGYFDACPDNGTNMLSLGSGPGPKLESAMAIDGSDGIPDTVYLDSGTYADADSFNVSGTDDLTLIGNGRDKTFLTSGASTNSYVLDLVTGNFRHVKMKDLAIIVPDSFPNGPGYGSAIQSRGDDFESVDVINDNPGGSSASSAFANVTQGGVFDGVRIFGRNGARFSNGISSFNCGTGQLRISQTEISDTRFGISTDCTDMPVTVERSRFSGVDFAISVANGAHLDASNILIESGDSVPIDVYNGEGLGATVVNVDQATVVATGDPTMPAIRAQVADSSAATDSVAVNVRNSIITGFDNTWQVNAPESNTRGDASLSLDYSSFEPVGNGSGDIAVNQGTGNISGSPGFASLTDYHLSTASPAVDAGDPNATDPALDLEGNGRPIDGNRDGVAVRDMGAYELNPPPPSCPADPSVCLPRISKVKVKYRARKGGALRFRLSREAKVLAVFTPVPKKAKGKKRRTVRVFRKAKAGGNTFKLGRKMLKPGRYRVAVRAIAADGDESNLVVRKLRVKPPRRAAGRA
ncbi:MAG: hypothetical protein J0H98_07855 [Solirubrobacterales bacterium]|nr:hypothetical protein [Solirubrobacterales bacterium]